MKYTRKAPKLNRNQPSDFHEAIVAPNVMTGVNLGRAHLTLRQIRLGLGVVWVAAALLAGTGIGRMINEAGTANITTEPPLPVATAKVVATRAVSGSISQVQKISVPDMTVSSATGTTRAQVRSVFPTLSVADIQPANTPIALQPGFNNLVRSQGNIGTPPVR